MQLLKKILWSVVSIAALTTLGCATSPSPTYYRLGTDPAAVVKNDVTGIVAIGPFDFPEYLNRPQLVTRGERSVVRIEELHRWAEPLDAQFLRTLVNELDPKLGRLAPVAYDLFAGSESTHRVKGQVQRFDVDASGAASLGVQWIIVGPSGTLVGATRRATYSAQAQDPDSFESRIDALANTISQFATDIAAQLAGNEYR